VHYEKVISNLEEVRARGGKVIASRPRATPDREHRRRRLRGAEADPLLDPILATVPLQLLAYHVADLRGTDVDQPRNLAKSVTVE
jgi:glucosamine--fructose-6-phosphate aminotransferase (isomerizing)